MEEEQLGLDLIESGDLTSAPSASPFKFTREALGLSIEVEGNVIEISKSGMQPRFVLAELQSALRRIISLLTARTAVPIRGNLKSFSDSSGATFDLPAGKVLAVSIYNFSALSRAFEWGVTALGCPDPQLQRAIHYFACGTRYGESWQSYVQSRSAAGGQLTEEFENSIWSAAFLEFWKAITAILDEPSARASLDRRFTGRAVALGFSHAEIHLMRSLKSIRDDFDVAHRAQDELSHPLPRRNVTIVQDVAQAVIIAYLRRLTEGKPGFGPHPSEVYRKRKGKRSALRRLRRPNLRTIARFVVEHQRHPGGRATFSYAGRDIVRWTIPIGKPQKGSDSKDLAES